MEGGWTVGVVDLVVLASACVLRTTTKTSSSAIAERPELQGGLVMAKSGRLELGDNIYGLYRSTFNHCEVMGQQNK